MTLAERLREHIAACFTGLWVQSHEHEDALRETALLCREHDWRLAVWDVEQGFRIPGSSETPADASATDPLAAVRSLGSLANEDGTTLLVLPNFHRFLQSAEIVQALVHQITLGKQNRTFIVVLSPVIDIPTELEKLMVVVEHELPGREQLEEIARSIATGDTEVHGGKSNPHFLPDIHHEAARSTRRNRYRSIESKCLFLSAKCFLTKHSERLVFNNLRDLRVLRGEKSELKSFIHKTPIRRNLL